MLVPLDEMEGFLVRLIEASGTETELEQRKRRSAEGQLELIRLASDLAGSVLTLLESQDRRRLDHVTAWLPGDTHRTSDMRRPPLNTTPIQLHSDASFAINTTVFIQLRRFLSNVLPGSNPSISGERVPSRTRCRTGLSQKSSERRSRGKGCALSSGMVEID
jgi:hypothetical protein